ncbi:unnamed protein product [Symbiodinium sp. CCMP2456]|nr:unnamed protein product [Symbiodinium sp. CCMP2456]
MLEDANCFAAFNLEQDIHLQDRKKFLAALCSRFNLDPQKAWRSFVGGFFEKAKWHVSPPGIAASSARRPEDPHKKIVVHLPDTASQRGWLSAWQEIRQKSGADHQELCKLVEVYLSNMSNSGTVDRYLGQVKLQSLRRGHIARGGLECALRVTVQDLGGRARKKLDATELLVEKVPKTTAGGACVAQPATHYALHCQKLYSLWFGDRCLPGRRMEPDSMQPEKVAKSRAQASKPRLAPLRDKSQYSEAAALQKHRDAVSKAVNKIEQGGGGEAHGPLGPVSLPAEKTRGAKRIVSQQASACVDVAKRRRMLPDAAGASGSSASASSSSAVPARPAAEEAAAAAAAKSTDPVHKKQAYVLEMKRQMAQQTVPCMPTPYVDANGGVMRADKGPVAKSLVAPPLPLAPRLHRCPTMATIKAPSHFIRTPDFQLPDVVLVRDLVAAWESSHALLARLVGARLVNQAWLQSQGSAGQSDEGAQVHSFKSVMRSMHFDLYLSPGFFIAHPEHASVFREWAKLSPTMKSRGLEVKRLTVQDLRVDKFPDQPFPGVTYIVKAVGEDVNIKNQQGLTLSEILLKMTVLQGEHEKSCSR